MPRPRKVRPEDAETADMEKAVLPKELLARIDPALPKGPQVYEILRRAIVLLALPPGASINEKLISEQLSISRTPFREALIRLNQEQLINVIPNSGTYVSKINLQTVFDGQLVRDALEMKVVRLAAMRMTPTFERRLDFNMHQQHRLASERDYDGFYELDEQFHSMICEFGASPRIWQIVNEAKAQLDRVRRLAFPSDSHLDIVLAEHTAIVDGLKSREPEAAAAAMKEHLDRVFLSIRRLITEKRDYFLTDSDELLDKYSRSTIESR